MQNLMTDFSYDMNISEKISPSVRKWIKQMISEYECQVMAVFLIDVSWHFSCWNFRLQRYGTI